MKLYELSKAYRLLTIRLEEAEGDDDGEDLVLGAALDSIDDAIEDKAEAIQIMTKEWEAEAHAIKEEEERLSRRRKALENRAKSIRKYLMLNLMAAGKTKLRTKLFSFTINKPKKSVEITDESKLPAEFVKTTYTAKKAEIKAALAAKRDVPGARLVLGEPSLTVR